MKKLDANLIKLQDILQAIIDIEDYKISDLHNKMALHAVLYNIAIIGEAAGKLSVELQNNNNQIPWAAIINMRNRIIHDYGNINIQTVQEVLDGDLPILKQQISKIIKTLSP
ncbi:MAG: HepT-like ribonuclease domain-containing protein [Pseudomonadota bacterium]